MKEKKIPKKKIPEKKTPEKKTPEKTLPLLGHLKELRTRLLRSFIVTILVFFACYFFRDDLLKILKFPVEQPLAKYSQLQEESISPPKQTLSKDNLSKDNLSGDLNCHCSPIEEQKNTKKKETIKLDCSCVPSTKVAETKTPLVFIGLPEVFFAELKISFFLALFFSFPYWIIEIWAFVLPGLYKKERKVFWAFVPATFLFFIGGASFGYFVVFPFGFEFFLSLTQPGEIVPFLSIGQYVSFAVKLLFAFGLVFEFPLIVLFLSRMGLLTPKFMLKNLKYAIIFIFICAAVLTPPDPFTMLLMAVPLILLYFFSIVVCFLVFNKKEADLRKQEIIE